MIVFIIDSENVGFLGMTGAEQLTEHDLIYWIGTPTVNAAKILTGQAMQILSSKAQVQTIQINPKNRNQYLDHIISTLVGYVMGTHPDATVVIISKDQGYIAEKEFWNQTNRDIHQASSIEKFLHPSGSKQQQVIEVLKKYDVQTNPTKLLNRAKNICSIKKQSSLKNLCESAFKGQHKNSIYAELHAILF